MAYCRGCQSNDAVNVTSKYNKELDYIDEVCNKCSGHLSPRLYRDASGQVVTMTHQQDYSYATGTPITSKRQFSEVLKKMNLVQTGGGIPDGYRRRQQRLKGL